MHGLGEIRRMNNNLSRNGRGSPWEVRWPTRWPASGERIFSVVRVADGVVESTHPKLRLARRAVVTLIKNGERTDGA
jgi:hypothetical protein